MLNNNFFYSKNALSGTFLDFNNLYYFYLNYLDIKKKYYKKNKIILPKHYYLIYNILKKNDIIFKLNNSIGPSSKQKINKNYNIFIK
jgi:hypothetical protein